MTSPSGSAKQVKVVIAADVAQAIRAIGQVNDSLGQTTRQGSAATQTTTSFSDKLKQGLATAGVATGFAAISSGLKGVVADGMDYERSQNQFQAVTGASADEMTRAGQTAKDLGNDIKLPGASAQTATAAMLELAKGGLTAQEAMDAARGTMTLATAAQIDGATAAEIQANALNSFGLEADQAGRVANVLANVANKSSGEITDFADDLLVGLDHLPNWPEKVRTMQENWIGKSTGLEFSFDLSNGETLPVYTTRPDTIFGATFVAIAADHPIARALDSDDARDFIALCKQGGTTEAELATQEKKGVPTGLFVTHPSLQGFRRG